MTTRRLYEAGALVEGKTSKGTWPIRIITEGKGSSGVYPRALLENTANHIFGGRAMFGNHPKDPSKPWERSPLEIKAKLSPNIEYKIVDGVAGLYGEAIVSEEMDRFLEEFRDVIGVSIFASGDGREDENGEYVVESFDGSDPYTSVDFVVAPGRGGGVGERMLEAYRQMEASANAENDGAAPADAVNEEKDKRIMDEATKAFIEALFGGLDAKFTALEEKIDAATSLVESVKEAQPERVEAVDAAGELATQVAENHLGEKAVKRVLESVKTGTPVADAIKHEVEIRDEYLAENADAGRFGGSADDKHDYRVTGLNVRV